MNGLFKYSVARFKLSACLMMFGLRAQYEITQPFFYEDVIVRPQVWKPGADKMVANTMRWASRPNVAMKPLNWAAKIIHRASVNLERSRPHMRRIFDVPLPTDFVWKHPVGGRTPRAFTTEEAAGFMYEKRIVV